MPDNRRLVKDRLGELGLGPHREEEIVRELSEHLDDHTDDLAQGGLAAVEAHAQALEAVSDWPALRNEIFNAETEEAMMNYRTKVLWLPALGALALSHALLALMQIWGSPPRFHWLSPARSLAPYMVFYAPWLISQPVVGAMAAYWSRRARGTVRHQLLAALAPAIALPGFLLPFLPVAVIVDWPVSHELRFWTGFLVMITTWGLLPAVPLLLGAAPFLRKPHAQS